MNQYCIDTTYLCDANKKTVSSIEKWNVTKKTSRRIIILTKNFMHKTKKDREPAAVEKINAENSEGETIEIKTYLKKLKKIL